MISKHFFRSCFIESNCKCQGTGSGTRNAEHFHYCRELRLARSAAHAFGDVEYDVVLANHEARNGSLRNRFDDLAFYVGMRGKSVADGFDRLDRIPLGE